MTEQRLMGFTLGIGRYVFRIGGLWRLTRWDILGTGTVM